MRIPPQELRNRFHPGLRGLDFAGLVRKARELKLLVPSGDGFTFSPPSSIYMDSNMIGADATVDRLRAVLQHLSRIVDSDSIELRPRAVDVQSCIIKIPGEKRTLIIEKVISFVQAIMAEFDDAAGDTVLDLQVFTTPIASLSLAKRLS